MVLKRQPTKANMDVSKDRLNNSQFIQTKITGKMNNWY